MGRYLLKISYFGKNYAGLQSQNNAIGVQDVLEDALNTYFKFKWLLVCSSRTDAGVHAHENFFHVDVETEFEIEKSIYHINCILPDDIVLHNITRVDDNFHARFSAKSRLYHYYINTQKNPFTTETSWYFPYRINEEILHWASNKILNNTNFTAFSKIKTQVNNFNCTIYKSNWQKTEFGWLYEVEGNRFLRGMVRALVATTLKLARGKINETDFLKLLQSSEIASADFSAPAHGLFLHQVKY